MVEKLGTIYTARAKLYGNFEGESGVLLGHCIDTPNAIAKALIELPNADMIYHVIDKKWNWRADYLKKNAIVE